jgi:hypothetical protein
VFFESWFFGCWFNCAFGRGGGGGVRHLVEKFEFIREDLLLVSILFRNPDPKLFIPHLIPDPAK